MKPAPFQLLTAPDLPAALPLLSDGAAETKPVAGSQSLGPMLNLRLARPARLLDISRLPELRRVEEDADAITYGAALTHAEFEDGTLPDATPGWLPAIARRIAYRAVRNRGTIGGSLAHADPAADWVNTLIALGASVRLAGGTAPRDMALSDFITGPLATALAPGEVITAIRIPRRTPAARWSYWKFCRKQGEFAKASAAILADPARGDYRVLAGALDRAPVLLPDARALIDGQADASQVVTAALPDLSPARLTLQITATRRALASLTEGTPA